MVQGKSLIIGPVVDRVTFLFDVGIIPLLFAPGAKDVSDRGSNAGAIPLIEDDPFAFATCNEMVMRHRLFRDPVAMFQMPVVQKLGREKVPVLSEFGKVFVDAKSGE